MLSRLNGAQFVLNPDLIERVESTPDTVITLVDGKHYLVTEGLREVIDLVQRSRAALLSEVATSTPVAPHLVDAPATGAVDHDDVSATHPDNGAVIPMRRHI